ncbi:MAG TPA: transcription-repair coupling factor, partial [Naasia sp.]
MSLNGLARALKRAPSFARALSSASRATDFSVTAGLQPALLAALLEQRLAAGSPPALFAITPTGREAEALRSAFACLLPDAEILAFPAWETLPHERLSPSAETVGTRINTLRRMRDWDGAKPLIVVGAVRAALQPLASDLTDLEPVVLTLGGRGVGLTQLAERLPQLAYARVDMVTRRGEFAVRGGILDVFPPNAEHPVRVDFFGDEVDGMRQFSVADQRSLPDEIREVELPASRELLLGPAVRQRAAEMLHEFPSLSTMLAKLAEGIPVEGMESLTPALVDRLVPVTSYLPDGAAVAVISPERVASRAVDLAETNREFLTAAWSAATAGAQAPIDLAAGDFLTLNQLRDTAGDRPWWTLTSFAMGPDDEPVDEAAAVLDDYLRVRGEAV